jgi:magnesium chelatase family protein
VSFSVIRSRAIAGLHALPVRVETDLANGLPGFSIVGLPDAAVREARERVRAAIHNAGFEFPMRRVTVSLAPADLPKDSGRFDLPIAVGILCASHQLNTKDLSQALARLEFVGELSLTGDLLPIRAAFALAMDCADQHDNTLVLPLANRDEVSLTESSQLRFAASLGDVARYLQGSLDLATCKPLPSFHAGQEAITAQSTSRMAADWSEIKGQAMAKRAAVIAAAGQHNLLMLGPPGVGKSMIASRIPSLLPMLDKRQASELAAVCSINGSFDAQYWQTPPFRSPHHSTPSRALIGGGSPIRPGEISLAHHGVLFLDELPEFFRDALESLREPLETGEISIARVRDRVRLPADFMLVAAMNPCPCGYFGARHPRRVCRCSPDRIERYRQKISGPLLDRFDMAVGLHASMDAASPSVSKRDAQQPSMTMMAPQTTAQLARLVADARQAQRARQSKLNSRLSASELAIHAAMDAAGQALVDQTSRHWGWSGRSQHRLQRVARTIADLAQSENITMDHLSEAIELRRAMDAR